MARVVHVGKDDFDVWVARGSKWGNPFKIGPDGTREEVIEKYKAWIVRRAGRHLLKDLGELEGRTIGCFCALPGGVAEHDPLVCHGQILLKLVSWRRKKIEERRGRHTNGGEGRRGFRPVPVVPARVVFCGSRTWTDAGPIRAALTGLPEGTVIVAGGARGADSVAEVEARKMGFPVEVYPALWEEEGRGAGYRRNERMVALPGVVGVYAFRMPGKSNGTDHTVKISRGAGIDTEVVGPA